MNSKYDVLKLENQLCFPLYAASRECIKCYKPHLDELDLTYTQYITMLVLWEHGEMNVKQLGDRLLLDSGTLTPLLKKLEQKDLISRKRSIEDERSLIVRLTEEGLRLRDRALFIPQRVSANSPLDAEETAVLRRLLEKMLTVDQGE